MVSERPSQELERRALRLLEELLEAPALGRAALLAERTQGEDELRLRVECLLAYEADGELTPPPDLPPISAFAPARETPAPVGRVGAYELIGTIGQGGMGRVFEAWQLEPRRRVALKMLHLGLDTESAKRRFRQESGVLAHLDHPAIARIIESGTHLESTQLGQREVPYFAMEFVEGGRPITEFAREAGTSRRKLLEVFARVCDAVHYGHEKGVIHRDLKPGNLLVDKNDEPKVIDFGVARVLSAEIDTPTLQTDPGQLVGTVQYMSPEQLDQLDRDLDPRADVYSLGVVLFELLCGKLPFAVEDKPLASVVRVVLEGSPVRPRSLIADLAPDLEAIVLKCLERGRERRYLDAAALAADLRRYLRDQPVEARRPGALYRLRLFARRNRALTIVAAALVVVGGSAALSNFVMARKSRLAQGRADTFQETLLTLNNEVTDDFLQTMTRDGVPIGTQVELVRTTAERLDRLVDEAPDEFEAHLQLAYLYTRLGGIQGNPMRPNAGLFQEAQRSYDRARELVEKLLETDPEHRVARLKLAQAIQGSADMARGRADHRTARLLDEEAIGVLSGLRESAPNDSSVLEALAMSHLFSYRGYMGDHDAMVDAIDSALELFRILEASESEDHSAEQGLASCYQTRGSILRSAGRLDEAIDDLLEAYQRCQVLLEKYPSKPSACANFTIAAVELSKALRATDYPDEAIGIARTPLESLQSNLATNARDLTLRTSFIKARLQLMRLLQERIAADAAVAREFEELRAAVGEELRTLEDNPSVPDILALKQQFAELGS